MFLVYKDENEKFQFCTLTEEGKEMVFSDDYEDIPGMWGDWVETKFFADVIIELKKYLKDYSGASLI
jgi:hypothetical protein